MVALNVTAVKDMLEMAGNVEVRLCCFVQLPLHVNLATLPINTKKKFSENLQPFL